MIHSIKILLCLFSIITILSISAISDEHEPQKGNMEQTVKFKKIKVVDKNIKEESHIEIYIEKSLEPKKEYSVLILSKTVIWLRKLKIESGGAIVFENEKGFIIGPVTMFRLTLKKELSTESSQTDIFRPNPEDLLITELNYSIK